MAKNKIENCAKASEVIPNTENTTPKMGIVHGQRPIIPKAAKKAETLPTIPEPMDLVFSFLFVI